MCRLLFNEVRELIKKYNVDRRSRKNLLKGFRILCRRVWVVEDLAREYTVKAIESRFKAYREEREKGKLAWIKVTLLDAECLVLSIEGAGDKPREVEHIEFFA